MKSTSSLYKYFRAMSVYLTIILSFMYSFELSHTQFLHCIILPIITPCCTQDSVQSIAFGLYVYMWMIRLANELVLKGTSHKAAWFNKVLCKMFSGKVRRACSIVIATHAYFNLR